MEKGEGKMEDGERAGSLGCELTCGLCAPQAELKELRNPISHLTFKFDVSYHVQVSNTKPVSNLEVS